MNKTSDSVAEFLSFWRSLNAEFEASKAELKSADAATQDLLHQLEFGNYKDRRRYATELARVRKERRVHKDYVDINQKLHDALNTKEFVYVYRQLEQLLGDVRKQEKIIEGKRNYRPRSSIKLTIRTTEENANE